MTVVAVTGHRKLRHPGRVREAIEVELGKLAPPLVGITALAAGADQLFAEAVLARGGQLEVVLPGRDYLESLDVPTRLRLERLLVEAEDVTELDFDEVGQDAYVAAGHVMLERCDVLFAVWDGGVSRGRGGTADIVRRAREAGIPVVVIEGERAAQ